MFKFNIGDRVKVLSSKWEGQAYGYFQGMDKSIGGVFTIKSVNTTRTNDPYYILEGNIWAWDERLLRRVRKAKIQPLEGPKQAAAPAIINNAVVYKDLVKELKNADKSLGICSFGIAYKNGETYVRRDAPCHYTIGGNGDKKRIALLLDISRHISKDAKAFKKYKNYCKYIFTKSPRADCFHYEGWEHAVEHGIFMNVSRPIEELAGAAVALREGSEYGAKLEIFQKLLDSGFSGNVAYLLSYCVSSNLKWCGFNDAHKTINANCSFDGIIKFFKEGYYLTNNLSAYIDTSGRYEGISKWCSPEPRTKEDNINTAFMNLLNVKQAMGWNSYSDITEADLFNAAKILEEKLK